MMSKGFSVTDILGAQSKSIAPAGQSMKVVMLPIGDIQPNPQNAIYEIGDVGMLQADISEHGLRTPLEVAPAQGGKYMLIAGHRRHTACLGLHNAGDKRFDLLPCVITDYGNPDEELVALITSNATARELTDGERLRQYEALKGALTRLKAEGKVDGRVREELARRTGEGSGTLARLNAVSARCIPEVKQMLEKGEITFTRAYECSKLYKVQQVNYAKMGFARMPNLSDEQKAAIIDALVKGPLKEFLSSLRYAGKNEYSYTCGEYGLISDLFVVSCDRLSINVTQETPGRFKAFVQQAEGMTCAYRYSEIDDAGKILSSNNRGSFVDDSQETADFLKATEKKILELIGGDEQ